MRERLFPNLTGLREVPADLLDLLKTLDTGKLNEAFVSGLVRLDDERLLSLPDKVESALGPTHIETIRLLHRLAVLYHSKDNLGQAELFYRRALAASKRAFHKPSTEAGLIMNNLGRLLHTQRKFDEAGELYQLSLCTLEQTLGAEHPTLATPLSNSARLCRDQRHFDRAEILYLNALAILRKTLGPQHPKVVKVTKEVEGVRRNR